MLEGVTRGKVTGIYPVREDLRTRRRIVEKSELREESKR